MSTNCQLRNAVNGFEQLNDIIPIRFTECESYRVSIGVNDQMAFQAF